MQPKRLGKYILVDRINHGGMADVFLTKALGFNGADTTVALKCIRPELTADPEFVRMFVDEAKLSVLLSHTNIARTYELGNAGSTYFIAMEYVAGRDVRALLDRAKAEGITIPEHLVLHIAASVCDGLDYAHRKTDPTGVPLRIVHRDVSPQNVLISYQGEVKLIDFGIAKAATEASRTQAGVLKGKHGYMSPEQVTGAEVDARSDVFAAGILLYELVTGERLFAGGSDFSVLEKVRNAEVYPPTLLAPSLPPEIDAITLRALSRDPQDRYTSTGEMSEAIVAVMLERYGPPAARELANLMISLFSWELREDQARLERARDTRVEDAVEVGTVSGTRTPPPGGATLVDRPSKGRAAPVAPRAAPIERTPVPAPEPEPAGLRETTDKVPNPLLAGRGSNLPTQTYQAYQGPALWRRLTAIPREALIIGAAVVLALALVIGAWTATRPKASPGRGALMVITLPAGAKVLLDGRAVGRTPVALDNLEGGTHTLQLDVAGYRRVVRSVDVRPGQMADVSEQLIRE